MRVCTGRYRGRALGYPRAGLRPTKDVTRQAIFNMLGERVVDARVCDLYAGGGSLGIEALSRGARSAVLVEQSGAVLKYLRANLAGIENACVVRGDVLKAMRRMAGERFDIILADPPYRQALVQATVDIVAELGLLASGGRLVVEHHRAEQPAVPNGWSVVTRGTYGESHVTVLTNGESQIVSDVQEDENGAS